ncbi:nuclear transport factor 2 family protein [Gemmobacter sp.]|uniref:nuclear transport factor 2 family protein n=1 Tax=Gemmobacter sp. TaxID=1898957 RepID=UPI002AFEC44B|nr:nuclear transport factor 2 family protein [Gemmobacter sp.]
MDQGISQVQAAEARRCALLMAGEADALEAMLADSLVHVHLNGRLDDKPGYMGGFRQHYRFHDVARGLLNIRVWGDTAVSVGPLTQRLEVLETGQIMDVRAITTQSWQRQADGRWLLTTCHNAPLGV